MWAKRVGGTRHVNRVDICVITALSDDSIIICGSYDTEAIFGAGEANKTVLPAGGFLARYNSDGTLAWAKSTGGTKYSSVWAITALSDDSVVISGYYGGTQVLVLLWLLNYVVRAIP